MLRLEYMRITRITNYTYTCKGIIANEFVYEGDENFAGVLGVDKLDLVKTKIAIEGLKLWAFWDVKQRGKLYNISLADFYNGECKNYIAGNVIIAGRCGENCKSLTKSQKDVIASNYKNGYLICEIDNKTTFVSRMKGDNRYEKK